MTDHSLKATAKSVSSGRATLSVIRGETSWTFFYVAAGFAISIKGTIISMLDPLPWWGRVLSFVAVGGVTFWAVLFNGPTQERLLKWRSRYESRAR